MDLDCEAFDRRSIPTSSYDATVATSVDVNFDAFNLTKEKLIEEGWTITSYFYYTGVANGVNGHKCFPVTREESYKQGKDVMDLDCEAFDRSIPASSYDADVATSVDVNFDTFNLARDKLIQEGWTISSNFDKCSPVSQGECYNFDKFNLTRDKLIHEGWTIYDAREESHKQERNEDASSMKFVDYHSSSSKDDEDSSSMSSIDYQYSEEDYDNSEKNGDDDDEEDEEDDEEEDEEGPANRPKLEVWVDSWKGKNHETPFAWVNVYAYYNKRKSYGGYGVILRDSHAKPITASAKFSADGKSFFTQVLMGIKAGLTLAEKHGCLKFCVECNSIQVPLLVSQLWECSNCVVSDNSDVCKSCNVWFTHTRGCDLSLVALTREIKALSQHSRGLFGHPRNANKAAHYVAKMGKKKRQNLGNKGERTDPGAKMGKRKRPNLENKEERTDPGDEELAETDLGDFPQELKEILWEDAFGEFVCYNPKGGY